MKVLHSVCQQIWKTQQWPQDWKRSVFIPIPKKGNAKECSNYHTIALISHASKVMLKILQAILQCSAFFTVLKFLVEISSGTVWAYSILCGKASISALLIMPKPLTVWITTNCGKFSKRWEYQTTSLAS